MGAPQTPLPLQLHGTEKPLGKSIDEEDAQDREDLGMKPHARPRRRTLNREADKKRGNRHSASFFVDTLSTSQNGPSSPSPQVRYRPASVIGLVHAGIPTFPGVSPSKRSDLATPLSCFFPFLPSTNDAWDSPISRDEESEVESTSSLDCDAGDQHVNKQNTENPANMTPSKEKRPLPSSKSFVLNLQPKTSTEWKDALAKVKVLFFDSQFKECAARCEALLAAPVKEPHPLQETYLRFVTGLSYEAIARAAHKLSAIKLRYLDLAQSAYGAAAACLPTVEDPNRSRTITREHNPSKSTSQYHDHSDDEDAYFSEPENPSPKQISKTRSATSQSDRSASSLGFRPLSAQSCRSTSSQSNSSKLARYHRSPPGNSKAYKSHPRYSFINSPLSYRTTQRYSALRPSPLRIRKSVPSHPGPSPLIPSPTSPSYTHTPPKPSTNTPLTPPPSAEDPFFPNSTSLQLSASTKSFFYNQTYTCDPIRLAGFTECLKNHIQGVEKLVQEARTAQMQKSVSQRWNRGVNGTGKDGEGAERREYIEKRRKEGWKMERFDAARIQRLCERALEEL